MKRAALTTLFAASALVLSGCVTVVVPDNEPDDVTPLAEDLDNRTELSCTPGEQLLLNNPSTLYTISGPCDDVTVEGTGLIVRAEQIDILVLRGDRNLIEATSIERVEISGQDNTVAAATVDGVQIAGDRNTVHADQPIDDADVSGNDNDLEVVE